MRARGLQDPAPLDGGVGTGDPVADLQFVQAGRAQQDHVADVAGGAVAARLGRDGQPGEVRVPDQRGHVVGVGGLDHGPHGLVDREVQGLRARSKPSSPAASTRP